MGRFGLQGTGLTEQEVQGSWGFLVNFHSGAGRIGEGFLEEAGQWPGAEEEEGTRGFSGPGSSHRRKSKCGWGELDTEREEPRAGVSRHLLYRVQENLPLFPSFSLGGNRSSPPGAFAPLPGLQLPCPGSPLGQIPQLGWGWGKDLCQRPGQAAEFVHSQVPGLLAGRAPRPQVWHLPVGSQGRGGVQLAPSELAFEELEAGGLEGCAGGVRGAGLRAGECRDL